MERSPSHQCNVRPPHAESSGLSRTRASRSTTLSFRYVRGLIEGHEGILACAVTMLATLGCYSVLASRTTAATEKRVLEFPLRTWVGQLYARPAHASGNRPWRSAAEGWRYFGEARDRIEVPAGTELMLRVHQRDLSFLRYMGRAAFVMLDCSSLGLTDDDTEPLRKTAGLRGVNLSGNPGISDFSLAHLIKHRDLEWLCVDRTAVSGTLVSAGALGHLEKLEYFSAHRTPFEDPGVAHLTNCARLRVLLLGGTRITDNSARHLAMLQSLESLSLENDRVGIGTLDTLRSVPGLRHLNLRGTPLGDRDVLHLLRLPELRFLNLDRTRITNASVPVFMSLPNLQQVSARETGVRLNTFPSQTWSAMPRIVLAAPSMILSHEEWGGSEG